MRSNEDVPAPEAEIFGKTLRRLREERGQTQEGVAHAAGLTTNYMSDLERGMKVPSLTTILQLAQALNVAPGELLADFSPAQLRRVVKTRMK